MTAPRPVDLPLPRRTLLQGAGLVGLGGIGLAQAVGTPSRRNLGTQEALDLLPTELGSIPPIEDLDSLMAGMCVLTPDSIEGPFYLDLDMVRKDISEGSPGLPITLFVRVVNEFDCSPVEGAAVDIWHCDAFGDYSGFPQLGTGGLTFLRGIQFTNPSGLACFDTIYPGWYPGRATHIHLKINPSSTSELTTQLYFPQRASDTIDVQFPPYDQHGENPTKNDSDSWYLDETLLTMRRDSSGIKAGITIGI